MKKTVLTLLIVAFATSFSMAQSVEDGIKFLYYERNQSALETMQKVVNKNPKDARALYWLGQVYLNMYSTSSSKEDLQKAQDVYQKALNDGINDPWIWVGTGHVELLENADKNAARQKFEQAITATTGKGRRGKEDPDILNAVGRANADGSSKQGDPLYGIEVLKRAAALDTKNPDIMINMGICYLKLGTDKGGEAVQAFQEAIARDPNYAKAYYRIGRVYESQNNQQYMNEWFGKAIAADPNYAPVYLAYFDYYKERDVNAAKEYLDKYVANADQDCSTEYFVADYLYRAAKYQESIAQLQKMQNGKCSDYVRINILYAYNYNRMGDSVLAKQYASTFLAQADTNKIVPSDYVIAGTVYSKFGEADSAANLYQMALQKDTVAKNKTMYLDSIAAMYKRANMPQERLEWVKKSYQANPNPTNRDIFDLGEAAFNADSLNLADSMFTMYKNKYPDQAFGYYWSVKVAQKEDSTNAAAVTPINEYINFLMKDSATNSQLIGYYHAILGGYYANTAQDIDSSLMEFEKAVQFDPANQQYGQYLDMLRKAKDKAKSSSKSPANRNESDKSKK